MIVGRGGEGRESTSARVVLVRSNACCVCVLAGAVCMLVLRTGYRVMQISTYVLRRDVLLIGGVACEGRGAARGAHLDLFMSLCQCLG